jgi:hypothetical protein
MIATEGLIVPFLLVVEIFQILFYGEMVNRKRSSDPSVEGPNISEKRT